MATQASAMHPAPGEADNANEKAFRVLTSAVETCAQADDVAGAERWLVALQVCAVGMAPRSMGLCCLAPVMAYQKHPSGYHGRIAQWCTYLFPRRDMSARH